MLSHNALAVTLGCLLAALSLAIALYGGLEKRWAFWASWAFAFAALFVMILSVGTPR